MAELKEGGELSQHSQLRQIKKLNNITQQYRQQIKNLIRMGLGFDSFWMAQRILADYDVMAVVRKGQVRRIVGRDIRAEVTFVAEPLTLLPDLLAASLNHSLPQILQRTYLTFRKLAFLGFTTVAQSRVEDLTLVSEDAAITAYAIRPSGRETTR